MIAFSRIGREPIRVSASENSASLEGDLTRDRSGLTLFCGRFFGKHKVKCDLCGEDYEAEFDEPIRVMISDGAYEVGDLELEEAVIELSGAIDPKEILRSEIASFECDYHRCDRCGGQTTKGE